MQEDNFYDRLQVSRTASTEEIKQAFRRLAKEYHPDTNGGNSFSSEKFQSIRTAYEILIDPDLRRNYNKSLRETLAKKSKEEIQEKLFTIDTPTKLEIILAWSTTRPTFKPSFVLSCINRMAEGRELTDKQMDSIDNVIISFQIDVDQWLNDELRNSAIDKFFRNYEEPFARFKYEEE